MKRRKGRQRQQQQQQQQEGAFSRALRLLHLPEDALVAILLAARPSLRALSCSCKQLNLLSRTRIPHTLQSCTLPGCRNNTQREQALARSLTSSRPPFSACTCLKVAASNGTTYSLLPGALAAAASWPKLVELHLTLEVPADEKEGQTKPRRYKPGVEQKIQQQQLQQAAQGVEWGAERVWLNTSDYETEEEEEEDGAEQGGGGSGYGPVVMEGDAEVRYTTQASRYAGQDLITAGPLHCLHLLPQLRRLELTVQAFGIQAARVLAAAAPQLTGLALQAQQQAWGVAQPPLLCHPPSDLSPLTGLTNLRKLVVEGPLCAAPLVVPQQLQQGGASQPNQAAAAAAGSTTASTTTATTTTSSSSSSCFPSSLTELKLDRVSVPGYWLSHLGGCPHLQQLRLVTKPHDGFLPLPLAHVAAAAAQHTPGLTSLWFYNHDGDFRWWFGDEYIGESAKPGPAGEVAVRRPQGALLALTGLASLQADPAAPLVVSSAADWEGLAQLKRLTDLESVDIRCPPTPELPPLPLVRLSDVRLRVSGAVLRQVLAKLPKLERLSIQTQAEAEGEEPEAAGGAHTMPVQAPPAAPLTALTSLEGFYMSLSAAAAAEHFSAAFGGGDYSRVVSLDLTWPPEEEGEEEEEEEEGGSGGSQEGEEDEEEEEGGSEEGGGDESQEGEDEGGAGGSHDESESEDEGGSSGIEDGEGGGRGGSQDGGGSEDEEDEEEGGGGGIQEGGGSGSGGVGGESGSAGGWSDGVGAPVASGIPDLTPFSRLQELRFGGEDVGFCLGWDQERGSMGEGEVLAMVRPVAHTLRELVLHDLPQLTPSCVVALQEALPALEEFGAGFCHEDTSNADVEEEVLEQRQAAAAAAVQHLVRPGLKFEWS